MENESEHKINAGVADFLQKKGTLELVVRIGEKGPQRHTDLRNELLMSSSTIQKRLKTGKQHNLWVQRLEERDEVAAKVYTLTSLGDELFERARDMELVELYQSRREIVRTIQNRERRVVLESSPPDADWISEITMEEHDLSHVQKFLQQFADN
jgi:DNA-binding HxlR family transcriptional regulator